MTTHERDSLICDALRAYALGLMDRANHLPDYNPYPIGEMNQECYWRGYHCLALSQDFVTWSIDTLGLDLSRPLDQQLWPHKTTSSCAATKIRTGPGPRNTLPTNRPGWTPRLN